jgi:uncharacterized protein (DUF2252 family)
VTWDERRNEGRSLRREVPRSAHAEWNPHVWRDPIAVLELQAETRAADLVPLRYGRMAESAFAFFRGGAAIMAMDLAATPVTGLRVEACGDAHVANFGQFATPERNVIFDINDFDETLPGPWEWDVKRLCASLHVVARSHGFTPAECDDIVAVAARTYRERIAESARRTTLDRWYDRIHIDEVIAHFPARCRKQVRADVARSRKQTHRRAVAKLTRIAGGEVRFREDPPVLVHIDNTEHDMDEALPMIDAFRETLGDDRQQLFERFRVTDIARKVVGVGSVGTRCWVVLLEGPDHPDGDRIILQVKEAQASVLEPYVGASLLGHHGRRVVAGQRLTQAASDMFLGWCTGPVGGRNYYVRQLWDVKGQGDLLAMDGSNLSYYGALCALALARAHARTGDPVRIAGYLGRNDVFDRAVVDFSAKYARANEQDHAALLDAIASGRVEARLGI